METIGIISNSDEMIRTIKQITTELLPQPQYTVVSFCYTNLSEIKTYYEEYKHSITAWIFSGATPYRYASSFLEPDTIAVACQARGLEYFRYFLKSIFTTKNRTLHISLDVPDAYKNEYMDIFKEALIPTDALYLQTFDPLKLHTQINTIVDQHLELFHHQKVSSILTSSTLIYNKLKEKEVPVEQVRSSPTTIKEAILSLKE